MKTPITHAVCLAILIFCPGIGKAERERKMEKDRPDMVANKKEQLMKSIHRWVESGAFSEAEGKDFEKMVEDFTSKIGEDPSDSADPSRKEQLREGFEALENKIREEKQDPICQSFESMTQRIKDGVGHGKLTDYETKQLQKGLENIREKKARYKSDGNFTQGERNNLERDFDNLSGKIAREKHNNRR